MSLSISFSVSLHLNLSFIFCDYNDKKNINGRQFPFFASILCLFYQKINKRNEMQIEYKYWMRQQKVTIIKSYERERMKNEQNFMEWATFYMDSHKKNLLTKPVLQIVLFLSIMGSMFISTIFETQSILWNIMHSFFILRRLVW